MTYSVTLPHWEIPTGEIIPVPSSIAYRKVKIVMLWWDKVYENNLFHIVKILVIITFFQYRFHLVLLISLLKIPICLTCSLMMVKCLSLDICLNFFASNEQTQIKRASGLCSCDLDCLSVLSKKYNARKWFKLSTAGIHGPSDPKLWICIKRKKRETLISVDEANGVVERKWS